MRQIAQVDPSPFWDKDVRVFEYARFKELRVSFASAVREKDMKTITALSQELLESPWLDPVPADLQAAARDVSDRLRLVQFDAALQELEAKLQAAYAAKSTEQCTVLLDKVTELMGSYGVAELPAESSKLVETARRWVKKQKRFAGRPGRRSRHRATPWPPASMPTPPTPSSRRSWRRSSPTAGLSPKSCKQRYEATLKRRSSAGVRRLVLALITLAALAGLGALVARSVLNGRAETRWAKQINDATSPPTTCLWLRRPSRTRSARALKLTTVGEVAEARAQKVDVLLQQADADTAKLRAVLASLKDVVGRANAAVHAEDADAGNNPSSTASLDALRDAQAGVTDALAKRSQFPDVKWVDPYNSLPMATKDLEARQADLKDRLDRGVLARVQPPPTAPDQLDPAVSSPASDALVAGVEHDLSGLRAYIQSGSEAATGRRRRGPQNRQLPGRETEATRISPTP